jgi:hypothetical protein
MHPSFLTAKDNSGVGRMSSKIKTSKPFDAQTLAVASANIYYCCDYRKILRFFWALVEMF